MFSTATHWLEENVTAINALNVFPVPDGDTGTNMLLTMRSTMEEAASLQSGAASAIAQAMAHGALMGARGNSGVILSQIVRGIADGLGDVECFGPCELARAFDQASALAHKAISKPKEGTILTVVKDVAEASHAALTSKGSDLVGFMQIVVQEAKKSVDKTPELLDVLKQAGVVDAGGQGLQVMLNGILHYLKGQAEMVELLELGFPATLQPAFVAAKSETTKKKVYGYCTEFLIKGDDLNPDWVRKTIEAKGDCVVVVGDEKTIKVHIHTPFPGAVLEFGTSWGSLHDLKIQNMDDQNEEFIQMRRMPVPTANIAVVSVVAGEGLESVFRSLGTTAVVSGGQSMNPSTEEILRAVESVPSDKVIILPNNKNVVLTAQQAAKMCQKKVYVLPTQTIPQGLAALVSFNCEAEMETNLSKMSQAQRCVKSIEVTKAVRAAKVGSLSIKKGEFIGLVDGKIKTACDNLWQSVASTLKVVRPEESEIATLYYGADVGAEEAQSLGKSLVSQFPSLQFEVIQGAQPHYSYIIAVE
jgi:DAK2 domain fusion protein YloV